MSTTAPDSQTAPVADPAPARRPELRIVGVDALFADRFLFARVRTDGGIDGIGESGAWGHYEASAAAIAKFADYLVGQDPTRIEHHWNLMQRFAHFRGTAIMGAVSAIDIALWDIRGKSLGVPVHELLGGRVRDRARLYAHVKAPTPEAMVERCLAARARGFTAIGHLNPFLDEDGDTPYFKTHARKLRDAVDTVRAIREAVGDDVDLLIEIHRRLTPAEAIAFAREIEPFRPMFLEDPIRPDNLDAMAEVASRTTIPIATGERFMSLYEFHMLLARGGVKVLRPSLGVCGGLTGGKKIAALAEAHHAEVAPHHPYSPVTLGAALQLDACIPNFAIQEYPTSSVEWDETNANGLRGHDLVRSSPRVIDGFVAIPDAPGIGVELDPDALTRRPVRRRPVRMRRHLDGSVIER